MGRARLGGALLGKVDAALASGGGGPLIDLMRRLCVDHPPREGAEGAVAEAFALGLAEPRGALGARLTPVGRLVADSFREYAAWEERGRAFLPPDAPARLRDLYRPDGRRLLEVGCGFGCNLLADLPRAARCVGVDLEPAYLELGRILARRAGLPAPETACASAERLPFRSGSFDLVLCLSVLQYVSPAAALAEIVRVLAPGGELLLYSATLGQTLRRALHEGRWLREPRHAWRLARMLAGTIATEVGAGRPARHRRHSTASPVHPTLGRHRRVLAQAGLELRACIAQEHGTVFFAQRM